MRLGSTIERVRFGRWLVLTPYSTARPYRDPANPGQVICPLSAFDGTTRTRLGARWLARRFERRITAERA